MEIIGYIHTDFPEKFGIPRQSGLIPELTGTITFCPKYRQKEAFRGLEDFSYIWVLWEFHQAHRNNWSSTVKPPKLGGNQRMGVFATRSPFRPNNIGLSSVKLDYIDFTNDLGPVLHVSGIDLLDGTPIYDIKPYLPYTDSHPHAKAGFTSAIQLPALTVKDPSQCFSGMDKRLVPALTKVLSGDPRPGYQSEKNREYGITFASYNIRFSVDDLTHTLVVNSIRKI